MAASAELPRILVVDDEEAILETMAFTFVDTYEVLTSNDAAHALELLDEHAPVAVVITDQRMPGMTGSELLTEVYKRHPDTTRIILTGFADMESTVEAINAGHVYAYVNKPWEQADLKQIVKRAYDHHCLLSENKRLLEDLQRAQSFLQAVIDRLDTGAIAVDVSGTVQAANRAAVAYLHLPDHPVGVALDAVMANEGLSDVAVIVNGLAEEGGGSFEDAEVQPAGVVNRVRVSMETLVDPSGEPFGRVILFKEVSHEPLRRRFEESLVGLSQVEGDLRANLDEALPALAALAGEVRSTGISSPGMAELSERVSRAQTAIQNWLDVDDLLVREDYPDAQLMLDRIRVASQRWPSAAELPERVQQLVQRVEGYYESGENSKQRVL
jgi:FixJ family two-component response regulator